MADIRGSSEIIIIIRHGHTLIYWFLPLMDLVRYKKKRKKNLFTLIITFLFLLACDSCDL